MTRPSYAVLSQSGELIAGSDEHSRQDPASTTKVMTLMTLSQLAKEGKISADFIAQHHGDVKTMMRDSSNPASHRLAEAAGAELGGGKSAFMAEMNRVAQDAGLSNSRFVTPDGMPAEGHYSTAYDMARMMHVFQAQHPEQVHFSSEITTGAGLIGNDGVDAFKTGTAHGLYGSDGKSSGVGIKDGATFAIAGAESAAARKAMVSAIAKNITPDSSWQMAQDPMAGEDFLGAHAAARSGDGRRGGGNAGGGAPQNNLASLINGDFESFLGVLLMALLAGRPSELGQPMPMTAGDAVSPAATPAVASADRTPNLPA